MNKIAVVYWSGTGNTEKMAEAVANECGGSLFTANDFGPDKMSEFDAIAFGCPSMGAEQLEESEFEPMFESVKPALAGKKIAVAPQREKPYSLVIGFVTGLLTGGTGVFVMPAVPWIQSLGFEKDELVQALGISFTFSTLALALGLWWHNALPVQSLSLSALAIVPALIGQWIGTRVRRVISPLVFKRCFLFCLVGLGTEMMLRAM